MRLAVRVLAGGVVLVALYLLWVFPRPARAPVGELAFAEIGSESSGAGHIAYYASGEGARVVLLASLGRSISDFNELAAALNADGWRTVAVESRAVGRSSYDREGAPYTLYDLAGDVEAALIADGAAPDEQVAVIGHAFGNRVARAFASQHPERVSRLVLVASGGSQRLEDDPRALEGLRGSFKWWLAPPLRRNHVRIAFFAEQNPVPGYWMAGWYRRAVPAQVAAIRATPVAQWRDAGGAAPMLILQGAQDRIAPAERTSEELLRDFPDRVRSQTLTPAGHALLPEAGDAIAQSVIVFLNASDDET